MSVCDGCQQRPCVCETVVLPTAENGLPHVPTEACPSPCEHCDRATPAPFRPGVPMTDVEKDVPEVYTREDMARAWDDGWNASADYSSANYDGPDDPAESLRRVAHSAR